MNKTSKNLTSKQTRALQMILSGASVVEAAATAKVSRGTVYNWLTQPEFRKTLNDEKQSALERLSLALASLGEKAIRTLDSAMEDADVGASVKIRAADIVINRILTLRETVDIELRLTHLEEIITRQERK